MRIPEARLVSFNAGPLAGIICVFLCAPAFSLDRDRSISQFYHTFWSEKDGAPGEISALAQTKDGYLWIGSARGLFRFDGVKFEEFRPQPGVELPSHSIYSLMATPDGGLWIAFEPTGVGFLNHDSLTVFTELPETPIHCFALDRDGRIWAGTETGLVFLQGTRWIRVGSDWNLPPEMVRHLLVDREGTLWVATVKRVAFLRRGSKSFELGGAVGSGITTLAEASDGRVWFADDGLYEARPVPTARRKLDDEFPAVIEKGVRELLFDRNGALWITRSDAGVVRIRYPEKLGNRKYGSHDPELESFGEMEGFSGGLAYKLLEDREGNIWIGCSNGLIRFRHNQVVPVSLPEGYEKLTLLAGANGDLWIGTINDKPLLQLRGETLFVEKAANQICSVTRTSDGDIWWGSRTGIWRQTGAEFKYFPLPRSAVPDWMYEIFPRYAPGGIWVKLGDVGFVRFEQGVWNLRDWPRGVPSTGGTFRWGPSASYVSESGQIWLGYTAGHVLELDGPRVTVYSQKDGLDVGRIKVIRGRGQHIWAGGELGLLFFSKGRFHRVTVAAGEPFGAVAGIIEMSDGGLWLNESRGIVHIPPEEIRQFMADPNYRIKYRRFDYLDGLPGSPQMSFTNSAAVEASDGQLWFATDNGLARIDPARLVWNPVPPPVSILSIGNETGHYRISNTVKFAAGTHNVEIDYTALSLSMPERVEFRYKLEGLDTHWQDVGTRRQAYYTHLGPGPYHFRVVACNNDGVWNDEGAFLDFSILPAFYQTTWFSLLCIAGCLVLLWALHQLRVQQLRRQFNAGLEARVQERMRIARELHDTLLQSLYGVLFRFQAVSDVLPAGAAKERLDSAIDQAARAISDGRDAVQDIRSSTEVTNELSQAIGALGQELATNDGTHRQTAFRIEVEGTPRNLHPILRDEVYRIAGEALRNAFRHAQARQIEVEIHYEERQFQLWVRDDGKGLEPTVLNQGGRPGHWGLHGMRERAKLIGGRLEVWSKLESGTEIELEIPATLAYTASRTPFWRRLFRHRMVTKP